MATYEYGEWVNGDLNVYYCCDPSYNQETRERILAQSAKHAAEGYAYLAQIQYQQNGDITIPVWVYDATGNETRWEVDRIFAPVFIGKLEE